jgi:hypothetical protein
MSTTLAVAHGAFRPWEAEYSSLCAPEVEDAKKLPGGDTRAGERVEDGCRVPRAIV